MLCMFSFVLNIIHSKSCVSNNTSVYLSDTVCYGSDPNSYVAYNFSIINKMKIQSFLKSSVTSVVCSGTWRRYGSDVRKVCLLTFSNSVEVRQ